MFCRARATVAGLVIIGFLLTFVLSCDPVQRHKILTYFFDGVPPLAAEGAGVEKEPVKVDYRSPGAGRVPEQPKTVWFMHEPARNCNQNPCHKRREKGRWALLELVKPVPELCYQCHTDYSASGCSVHGPVAVGQCLFCHNQHKSKNEHLLKEAVPGLCYQCHNREMVESIPNHSAELSSKCTNCHDAHTSLAKGLLKTNWKEKAN